MTLENPKDTLSKVLACAKKPGISDIHLIPNTPPRVRMNGKLVPVGQFILSAKDVEELLKVIINDIDYHEYSQKLEYDFSFDFEDICRFRANAFFNINGPCAVFRVIPTKIPKIDEINAPPLLLDLASLKQGLVLVTGPTGSGKSTTLAAMIEYINQNYQKHIITIEDPVEFQYVSANSLINQRQLHHSTKSFPNALKACLREDPDIILVGEMRDPETIQLALSAAETGHLVFSTLHTNNAYESINRIIDVFPAESKNLAVSLLSTSLSAVISQRLVTRKDEKGRFPLHEVLIATPAVKNLIREENIPQIYSMMQVGKKFGMKTMLDSAADAVAKGIIGSEIMKELKPENKD